MDTSQRTQTLFFILFILYFSHQIISAVGDGGPEIQETKPLSKMVTDTVALLRKSHKSSWEKVKSLVHQVQSQYFPANLEGGEETKCCGGGDSDIKGAAKKSVTKGKETVEESAKSAGEMVGEAAQKVKETVGKHDEL